MTATPPPAEQPDAPRDTGYAPPRWAFDEEVSRVFEDMLWRSIPGYAVMRELVSKVAARHVKPDTTVLDLGCSRGGALAELMARVPEPGRVGWWGVEVSEPMVKAARDRFSGHRNVVIDHLDLRDNFPRGQQLSVVMAVLTLQFIPVEHRARLVRRAAESLASDGVLVVVEKVLGDGAWGDELLVADYYDFKRANGYTQDEIDRKRLALEGVLVPQTEGANVDMFLRNGFSEVQAFWRHLNFAGWLARR